MAERIVDGLEAIEIDKKCRQRGGAALAASNGSRQVLAEKTAVGQTSKLIVLCPLLQFTGLASKVCDITKRDDTADQLVVTVIQTLAIDAQNRIRLLW